MRARATLMRRGSLAISLALGVGFMACADDAGAPLRGIDVAANDGGRSGVGDGASPDPDGSPRDGGRDAAGPSDASTTDAEAADAADAALVDAGPFACENDATYPATVALPEASAATEVELTPGVREMLIVSDSGNAGAALSLPIAGGVARSFSLALDAAASDDLEGIAWRGGKLYTLTSSGAVRRFTPNGSGGLVRDQDAYPLGPVPHACADLGGINCGRNYEGLCLRSASIDAPCAGYAASRADGKLYCLTLDGNGVLAASTIIPPIDTGLGTDKLSDCAFGTAGGGAEHVLTIAGNVYDLSRSYRIDEASGQKTQLPTAFLLNLEAVALDREGALYTFSDDNSQNPSPTRRLRCVSW